mgnify:CR=1 FL=1
MDFITQNYPDFLGYKAKRSSEFLSFADARDLMHRVKLRSYGTTTEKIGLITLIFYKENGRLRGTQWGSGELRETQSMG